MNRIKVFSPATVANISCGFDVLGLALNQPNDEIIIYKSNIPGIRINKIYGAKLSTDINQNVVGVALQALLKKYNNSKIGFEIEIIKNILPGSGIGSSAASAAGVVIGANILLGNPFTINNMIDFAMQGECLAVGNPHADNVAPAIIGGITLVRSYNPLDIISIHIPDDLWVTIIHPQIEIKTSDARSILKKNISITNAVQQWGNVGALIAGFYKEDYNLISRSLHDVIFEPIRSILIPEFINLKTQCKAAGALGGGISGSGPSVFMLSQGQQTAFKIAQAMNAVYSKLDIDYKIYNSPINKKGIRYIELKD